MKRALTLTLVCTMAAAAFGQTFSTNVAVNAAIPDNNASGLSSAVTVSGLGGTITNVTVTLDITGGYNGDYYAYLAGPNTGFAVLLNRTGTSNSASAFGYGDAGFNVTFSDSAANGDIHYYQNVLNPGGLPLTGIWQPDGAIIDPLTNNQAAFLTAGQTAMLSSFTGDSANGQWVFFVADLSGGGQGTLASWGLTVMTAPEPSGTELAVFAGLLAGLFCFGRHCVRRSKARGLA